jgi:hypothetical protein
MELVRIDDYPSGVRPLVADIGEINSVLLEFERFGIDYYLGIVPAILDDGMRSFLSGLRCMRPVLHGYDHGYPRFSKHLLEHGDPFNKRGTVGGFDEFRDEEMSVIRQKLEKGKTILEEISGAVVTDYIPPCNMAGSKTGSVLEQLGFRRYFSEKEIPRCSLVRVESDFYGCSADFPMGSRARVITLHVTWEYDLFRRGDSRSLVNLLHYLQRCRKRRRNLVEKLFSHLVRMVEAGQTTIPC